MGYAVTVVTIVPQIEARLYPSLTLTNANQTLTPLSITVPSIVQEADAVYIDFIHQGRNNTSANENYANEVYPMIVSGGINRYASVASTGTWATAGSTRAYGYNILYGTTNLKQYLTPGTNYDFGLYGKVAENNLVLYDCMWLFRLHFNT